MKINLVTGSTGFIGRYLVKELLRRGEIVWVIIRNLDGETSEQRAKRIFQKQMDSYQGNFKVICGDVTLDNLGLEQNILSEIQKSNVVFWNLAANLSFSKKLIDEIYTTNVGGTVNVVDFVNKYCSKLLHMSTAYVCGDSLRLSEEELDVGQKHRNPYETSKFKSEQHIRSECKVDYLIFRPSIVMGDAYKGKAEGCTFGYYRYIHMFYFLKGSIIKALDRNKLSAKILRFLGTNYDKASDTLSLPWFLLPYPKKGYVDMVTLDYVINSMLKSQEKKLSKMTFNLTNPNPPTFEFILKRVLRDFGLINIKTIPVSSKSFEAIINILHLAVVPLKRYLTHIKWYVPYITKKYIFVNKNLEVYLDQPPTVTEDFLYKINKYAIEKILKDIDINEQ